MTQKTIVFFYFCQLICITGFAMPSYKNVADEFKKKYNPIISDTLEFRLEKRKAGWYIALASSQPPYGILKSELFWNKTTGKFIKLDYDEYKYGETPAKFNEPVTADLYYFEHCIYYGYVGWDADLINDFEDELNNSDTITEGLARAYDQKALSYLWSQNLFQSRNYDCPPSEFNEPISNYCVGQYIRYAKKSIETYKKLAQKNPTYKTLIGTALVKYSNQIVSAHHALLMAGYTDKDVFSLKSTYDQSLINIGLCYLNSVDSNAILFTIGDLDTYAVTYLQAMGYRTDVSIVSLGLLALPRYAWTVSKTAFGNQPIKMSLLPEIVLAPNTYYLIHNERVSHNNDGKWYVKDWISLLNDTLSSNRYYNYVETNSYLVVPSKKLHYEINGTIIPYVFNNYYLSKADLYLLDIINTNAGERPIYFTVGTDMATLKPFNENLWLTGMTIRLESKSHPEEENKLYVDINESLRHLSTLPFFDKIDVKQYKNSHYKSFAMNYRNAYIQIARDLLAEKRYKQVNEVLDHLWSEVPYEYCTCDVFCSIIIEYYLNANNKEKAVAVANVFYKQIIDNENNEDIISEEEFSAFTEYIAINFENSGLKEHAKKWRLLSYKNTSHK